MTEQFILGWGLQPDRPCLAAWGARAIYHPRHGLDASYVDLLWDRQDAKGPKPERDRLLEWLNEVGIAAMRKVVDASGLTLAENRRIEFERDGVLVVANPNASHGYLYICAMLLAPEGNQNATP